MDQWKATVEARPGFDDDQKQHMVLSSPTEAAFELQVCTYTVYIIKLYLYCSEVIPRTGTTSPKARWS